MSDTWTEQQSDELAAMAAYIFRAARADNTRQLWSLREQIADGNLETAVIDLVATALLAFAIIMIATRVVALERELKA